MKRIIMTALATAALAGCQRYDVTEILIQRTDISLTWKKELQVSYDPASFQLGYNEERNEYRVYDDKMANWFVIQCDARPANVGQKLRADVTWTGKTNTRTENGIEFSVEKTDRSGHIWMWSKDAKIGVVVRNL